MFLGFPFTFSNFRFFPTFLNDFSPKKLCNWSFRPLSRSIECLILVDFSSALLFIHFHFNPIPIPNSFSKRLVPFPAVSMQYIHFTLSLISFRQKITHSKVRRCCRKNWNEEWMMAKIGGAKARETLFSLSPDIFRARELFPGWCLTTFRPQAHSHVGVLVFSAFTFRHLRKEPH